MLSFTVNKNDAGKRADRFLLRATDAPASLIYRAFRKKDIKLNGIRIKENAVLSEGDSLVAYISDEFAKRDAAPFASAEVDVVYEDENIAVLNKPKGLPSQPDSNHADALSERFKAYLEGKGEYSPSEENSFAPALCNRLDTNTGGLVIGAKNAAALREMNAAVKARLVKKFYLCRTVGTPTPPSGVLISTISKDAAKNKSSVGRGGKPITTAYRVLEPGPEALVEVELFTGRSHQIRAQMAAIGHPLVGDGKYGAPPSAGGQRLTAYKIAFTIREGMLSYLNGKEITLDNSERTV